jgi:hypothetical protein
MLFSLALVVTYILAATVNNTFAVCENNHFPERVLVNTVVSLDELASATITGTNTLNTSFTNMRNPLRRHAAVPHNIDK